MALCTVVYSSAVVVGVFPSAWLSFVCGGHRGPTCTACEGARTKLLIEAVARVAANAQGSDHHEVCCPRQTGRSTAPWRASRSFEVVSKMCAKTMTITARAREFFETKGGHAPAV